MPSKLSRTRKSKANNQNLLWIAPRYRLKTGAPPPEWDTRPTPNRLIELADTALGLWELSAKSKGRRIA